MNRGALTCVEFFGATMQRLLNIEPFFLVHINKIISNFLNSNPKVYLESWKVVVKLYLVNFIS